jgi:hypothetical protein
LQGQEKPRETNVIEVASETVITLVCPTDGKFEVSAGEFRIIRPTLLKSDSSVLGAFADTLPGRFSTAG